MNNTALHLTLREIRENLSSPRTLGVLLLVSLVLGLSGPFETFVLLEPVPRVIYWTAMCGLTYIAGWFAGGYVLRIIEPYTQHKYLRILACGIASGLAVWPVVIILNVITFGKSQAGWIPASGLLIYCVLIAITVAAASTLKQNETTEHQTTQPKIVSRLPQNLRGTLISLSVQDHYVEVATNKGTGLVHFRLLDAIDDCDEVEGLQIHRSHWVAIAGIKSVFRRDGKTLVETIRGDLLPVSRTHLPKIKQLGLL